MNNDKCVIENKNAELVNVYNTDRIYKDWLETYQIDISKQLKNEKHIYHYRCPYCDIEFFKPSNLEGDEDLYTNLQRFEWFYMESKWEFQEAIKETSSNQNILEIGCGPGHFIEIVKNNNINTSIKGIELNTKIALEAKKKGLTVESSDLSNLIERKEKYDLICTFQVVEHLAHPFPFLEDVVNLLNPNGKLIISVPNKNNFEKHVNNILDLPPHHMTRWSEKSLRYLTNLLPLKLIRIAYEPLATYHVEWYLHVYRQFLLNKLRMPKHIKMSRLLRYLQTNILRLRINNILRGHTVFAVYRLKTNNYVSK